HRGAAVHDQGHVHRPVRASCGELLGPVDHVGDPHPRSPQPRPVVGDALGEGPVVGAVHGQHLVGPTLGDLVGHPGERAPLEHPAGAGATHDVPDPAGEGEGQVMVVEIAHAELLVRRVVPTRSLRRRAAPTRGVVGVRHHVCMSDVLDRFHPATAAWFRGAFGGPTPAQKGAWESLATGSHTLVVAPTGSGKTLSAFLAALDRLVVGGDEQGERPTGTRVLYVSPLKALAVDVERNLRAPLAGIAREAAAAGVARGSGAAASTQGAAAGTQGAAAGTQGAAAGTQGAAAGEVTVGIRTGDTPPEERRRQRSHPPDILVTTPESLFLLLTSAARETLATVDTVIIDEVHAVAATKRGAHLALSLERLDALLEAPAQRVGLSATVRPHSEVARFLAGERPVSVVAPESDKGFEITVRVPVEDMADLGATSAV